MRYRPIRIDWSGVSTTTVPLAALPGEGIPFDGIVDAAIPIRPAFSAWSDRGERKG